MGKKENRTSRIGRHDRRKEAAAPSAASARDPRGYHPLRASGANRVLFFGKCNIPMAVCLSCGERTPLSALWRHASGARHFARRSPKGAAAQCHRAPCPGCSDRCWIPLRLGSAARKSVGGLDCAPAKERAVDPSCDTPAIGLVDSAPSRRCESLEVGVGEFQKPDRCEAPELARKLALRARGSSPAEASYEFDLGSLREHIDRLHTLEGVGGHEFFCIPSKGGGIAGNINKRFRRVAENRVNDVGG